MNLDDLTPEQKEQLKASKTPEELLALAREAGYDLSEEELEGINGGHLWSCHDNPSCPPYVCTNVCKSGSSFASGLGVSDRLM